MHDSRILRADLYMYKGHTLNRQVVWDLYFTATKRMHIDISCYGIFLLINRHLFNQCIRELLRFEDIHSRIGSQVYVGWLGVASIYHKIRQVTTRFDKIRQDSTRFCTRFDKTAQDSF